MTDANFVLLKPGSDSGQFQLAVDRTLSVGHPDSPFMFGGVGLAAAILAMERVSGRPIIWATAQYLTNAWIGSLLDIDVIVPVRGRHNTQARVVGHVGEREILTVNGALGSRPGDISEQWTVMFAAPPPQACVPMAYEWARHAEDLHAHFDCRQVKSGKTSGNAGDAGADGHVIFWGRARDGHAIDAGILSILADFLPSTIHAVTDRPILCTSLDNTIRFHNIVATDWVLCDVRIDGIHGNIAHGRMNLFAQDGRLMACASQSIIVRPIPCAN